jgi:hypothetical protein
LIIFNNKNVTSTIQKVLINLNFLQFSPEELYQQNQKSLSSEELLIFLGLTINKKELEQLKIQLQFTNLTLIQEKLLDCYLLFTFFLGSKFVNCD